jgi:hypothetical protein
MNVTFRLVALTGDRSRVGQTALTPDLAKLVPGELVQGAQRLGMERTDWAEQFGKPKPIRTVLIDAESKEGEWQLGATSSFSVG